MEKPWLKFYEPGVPENVNIPKVQLQTLLEDSARDFPTVPACVFIGNQRTYKEINDAADRLATALVNIGIKQGDVVGILLGNMPQFLIAFFGILKAGGIVTVLNPLYQPPEIQFQLKDSGAKAIIIIDIMHDNYDKIRANTSVKYTIVTTMGDAFPGMPATFQLPKVPGYYLWGPLLEKTTPKPLKFKIDPINTPAVLLYTGGTTGVPKGAMLTHYNLVADAHLCRSWIPFAKRGTGEATLAVLPLFHSFGLTVCMMNSVLLGGCLILHPRPDLDQILRDIPKYKVKFFPGVPTMYINLINRPDIDEHDLSSVTACLSGAAPLPMAVAKAFEKKSGANLVEGYGLTESSPVSHSNPIQEKPPFTKKREGSIGVPFPNTLAKIVDLDTGTKDLPPGEVGELVLQGPQVMKGYWNKPEETAKVLRNGWLYTGDIAKMDKDGYFYIVDRKKLMIDRAGFKIWPRDVEEVLFTHPAVADAAVIGVPDEKRGETVKAFVVLKEGKTAKPEDIIAFCKDKLAYYKVPQFVEFRASIPKTMIGKTLHRALQEEEAAKRAKPAAKPGAKPKS